MVLFDLFKILIKNVVLPFKYGKTVKISSYGGG